MPVRLPLLCLVLLTACDDYVLQRGSGGGTDRIDTILGLTGDAGAGDAAFTGKCLACHDKAGEADKVGPALGPLVPTLADDELVGVMVDGSGSMPPANVDDQDAADILAWLRQQFGG
jgi:mono/diheme cytochrome c family protein